MADEKNLKNRSGPMGLGWYYDFKMTLHGQQKRFRGFGGHTKEEARFALARLRTEKLEEKRGIRKVIEPVLFSVFADEFIKRYSEVNKRSADRDRYSVAHLKRYKEFKSKCLTDISAEHVEGYKALRQGEGAAAGTINRELACLKTIFNKAVEWGKLEKSPIAKVKKLKEPPKREKILSDEECRKLIEASPQHLKPVLTLLLITGMRKNEALGLKWACVDFHKGFIAIENSKNNKARKIPMPGLVFEMLHDLKPSTASEFVFLNPWTKKPFVDITTGFKAACDDAGIKGVRLHDLRHTAGSKMVEAGIDLVTVSEILGHSSIQMTMRYVHPTPERKRLAVEKLANILAPGGQKEDTVIIHKPITAVKLHN